MTDLYPITAGPSGQAMTSADFWKGATSQPFSWAQTLGEGAIEGFLGSPGIGTYARELQLPDASPQVEPDGALGAQLQNPPGYVPTTPDQQQRAAAVRQNQQAIQQQNDAQYGALTEAQQKDSPDFRPNVGVQSGMTAARQAALAEWNDAKEYRAQVLDRSNHGLLRFVGGVAGSLTDPVNYIPIIGPEVRAAAVARWGFAGAAGITAADAALNAGLASAATAPVRAGLGDDVSWQAIVSQMAMAALGGAVVGGAIHGARRAVEAWSNDRAVNSLENVMKSRAILNEAIDGVARGEDIALSPAARTEIARVGDETAPHVQPSEAAVPPVEREFALSEVHPVERPVTVQTADERPTVFHGTLSDFSQFDTAHLGKESDATRSKLGFFFTDNPDVARTYASADRYAALKRILPEGVVDGIAKVSDGVLKLFGAKPGRQEGRVISAKILPGKQFVYELPAGSKDFDPAEVGAAIAHAKERGFDSVMIKNMVDDGYGGTTGQASNVHVVFKPEQIQILDHGLPGKPAASKPDGVYRGNALKAAATPDAKPLLPGGSTLENTASWVIRNKVTKEVIMETFDPKKVERLNTDKYEAVPIGRYLGEINGRPRTLDHSAPRAPEPDPAVKQAAAKVGKPADLKAVAAEVGVNPETGAFAEQSDIAQLKAEGRLSADDLAELDAADQNYQHGSAWAEALQAAFTCVAGAA